MLQIETKSTEQLNPILNFKNITIHAVDGEKALQLLKIEEEFLNNCSLFDFQTMLKTEKKVTKEDYFEHIAKHILNWDENKNFLSQLTTQVSKVNDLFEGYNLKFPSPIYVILTNGKDLAGAAYCKGQDVIVLPQNFYLTDEKLFKTFIHESFHILSKNNLEIRDKLYKIIGFIKTKMEVKLPEQLIRITNPGITILIIILFLNV